MYTNRFKKVFTSTLIVLLLQALSVHIMPSSVFAKSKNDVNNPNPHSHTHALDYDWNSHLIGTRSVYNYENVTGVNENLYLFKPVTPVLSGYPLVVYIHGGGLYSGSAIIGDDSNAHNFIMTKIENELLHMGIAFASINYRLAPEFKWPSQLQDAKTAIRFLRANAQRLGIDPNKIAVIGDSGGGELATFVGLTSQLPYGVSGPWQGVSSSVSGVVDMFGPSNREYYALKREKKYGNLLDPVYGLYTTETIRQESTVNYVQPGDPPFLIIQGNKDTVVPPIQSIQLYNRLVNAGNNARLIIVHNAMHEFYPNGGPIEPNLVSLSVTISNFLQNVLLNP